MNDNHEHEVTDAEYEAAIGEPPPPETEQLIPQRRVVRVDARAGGGLEDVLAELDDHDDDIVGVIPLDHGRAALIVERSVPWDELRKVVAQELGDDD